MVLIFSLADMMNHIVLRVLNQPVWRFLKELIIDLPYGPAIALLGIYPKDTDAMKHRDTCTPMFIVALSTIAKLWKEPRGPSTVWLLWTMELLLSH